MGQITDLLIAWREGDETALDRLMPLVYEQLHEMADRYMRRERPDHTLETAALVNEAYLRLAAQGNTATEWQNRSHYFAVAAVAMRRVLVDHARSRRSAKRGGGAQRVPLEEAFALGQEPDVDLLGLDEALQNLGKIAPRKVQIVELRYFAGLTVEETAHVLGIAPVTVMREWRAAKEWLYQALRGDDEA